MNAWRVIREWVDPTRAFDRHVRERRAKRNERDSNIWPVDMRVAHANGYDPFRIGLHFMGQLIDDLDTSVSSQQEKADG